MTVSSDSKNPSQTPPAPPQDRLAVGRQFAIDAARLAADTHCRDVTVLEVSGLSPVTDFFVIATGNSPRQMRGVCDEIEELGLPRGFKPLKRSGYEGQSWILIDFVDVILHFFSQESRAFYDLDSLWGDARKIDWRAQPPPRG